MWLNVQSKKPSKKSSNKDLESETESDTFSLHDSEDEKIWFN